MAHEVSGVWGSPQTVLELLDAMFSHFYTTLGTALGFRVHPSRLGGGLFF